MSPGARFVVRPQRDREPVALVDARLDAGLEPGHRGIGFGEPLRDLDFELGACPVRDGGHAGEHAAGQQAHGEPVRVVEDDRVIGAQVEGGGRGHACGYRAPSF